MADTSGTSSWVVPLRWLQIGSVVVPLLLSILIGWWLWRVEQQKAEELVLRNALLAGQYNVRVLSAQQQLLRHADGFAWQAAAEGEDGEVLQQHLARLVDADEYSRGMAIVRADGKVVVSDRDVVEGLDFSDRPYFIQLREKGWQVVIDRRIIEPDGADSLVLAIRRSAPGFAGIIVTAFEVQVLADFFGTLAQPDGAAASLIRDDGLLLIRHDASQPPLQLGVDRPVFKVIRGEIGPFYETTAASDGITRLYATVPLAGLPLYASFGLPVSAIWWSWGSSMLLVVATLATATTLVLLMVTELDRRVQARFAEEAVTRSRMKADYHEMLFHELNHRIKNNLQIVESLLRLRSRGRSDVVREVLNDVAVRIGAIGQVHAELVVSDRGPLVDLSDILIRLSGNPSLVPPEHELVVDCRAPQLLVPVDQANSLALIAVEAITNAVKYAFPDRRGGRIKLGLRKLDHGIELTVEDNGRGFDVDHDHGETLGLTLIKALAKRLGGTVQLDTTAGTRVTVVVSKLDVQSAA